MSRLILKYLFVSLIPWGYNSKVSAAQPEKRALLVGIGRYPVKSGWNNLHGNNDAHLFKQLIISSGFKPEHIRLLENSKATKKNIVGSLEELTNQTHEGDIVVVFFSGHGQQVQDRNNDEPDGLDEALVPFDAPKENLNLNKNYRGEQHITDDELAVLFTAIRKKSGPPGQLIVFADACNSGSLTRGAGSGRVINKPIIFDSAFLAVKSLAVAEDGSGLFPILSTHTPTRLAPLIFFASSLAFENSYEHPQRNVGYFTYALSQVMPAMASQEQPTYRILYELLRNRMAIINPCRQTPVLEGEKDLYVFGKGGVFQEPYFHFTHIEDKRRAYINGGELMGISKGTILGLFPPGTTDTSNKTPRTIVEVEQAMAYRALVRFKQERSEKKYSDHWLIPLSAYPDNLQTRIFLNHLPDSVQKMVTGPLNRKRIILVGAEKKADLIITHEASGKTRLINTTDLSDIVTPFNINERITNTLCTGETVAVPGREHLHFVLQNYSLGKVLRYVQLKNPGYRLALNLQKKDKEAETYVVKENQGEPIQVPVFSIQDPGASLVIKNTGVKQGYIYIMEIQPDGKICPIKGFDDEILLPPGKKYQVSVDGFLPPFGRYLLKGIITSEPIGNELGLVILQQKRRTHQGTPSSIPEILAELLDEPAKTRSAELNKGNEGSITDYAYDIIETKSQPAQLLQTKK